MSKRDEQLARMKGLMTYGTTNTSKKTPVTESIEGPDGNVYAIIREGSKYYIKSTPKGSELVKESFDYIGGFMNKKNNEFSSYNQASKNLELKVRSLNEAYGVNKPVELLNPDKKESLMVEMTDAMKASIARYRQIVNEASAISMSNTGVPEAPKTTNFSPKLGEPFTNSTEATLDKDLKKTATDPEKQSEPFGDNTKAEEYTDAKYVPDGSVANKKPSGGKVVRVNECNCTSDDCCCYEESYEDCEDWGSCGLPSNAGTGEIGDGEPFTNAIHESDASAFAGVPTTTEGEDEPEEDIDLDDIDMDLDSDDTEDIDLDDVNTGDETSEESEIEELRAEVEELRALVNKLIGDDEDDIELDSEDDFEDDDDDNEDFDPEDEDEYEVELDSDEEGDNDEEVFPESYQYTSPLLEARIRTDFLKDPRHRYYIGTMLSSMAAEAGANERDMRLINNIKGRLMEILEYETELNEYKNAGNFADDEAWDELLTSMENDINQMVSMINQLSFIESVDRTTIDRRVNRIVSKYDELRNFYEENVDPDTANGAMNEPTVEPDDEEDAPEVEMYNDNEGFEDDAAMSDDEMDARAWANAEDFDYRNLDLSSVTPRRINEAGTKLNVFGKHPGYRSKVMTLPKTVSDNEGNYRDWNDESVYSEEPWGEQIGDSAPFTDVVKDTVSAVVESLKKKL